MSKADATKTAEQEVDPDELLEHALAVTDRWRLKEPVQRKGFEQIALTLADEVKRLTAHNQDVRKRLQEAMDYAERVRHPEPYKIGAVIGIKDNMHYALQISRVINQWPDTAIEVFLP